MSEQGCLMLLLGVLSSRRTLMMSRLMFCATLLAAAATVSRAAAARPCSSLTALTLPNITITSAIDVPAGIFTPPKEAGPTGLSRPAIVPAFCRVIGVARPTSDSVINFEVWLPVAQAWKGKFLGAGNGGYFGSISYGALADALRRGYAAASTDTGHKGDDVKFAVGHPEKIIDWAYRGLHVTTAAAKLIIRDYYGRFPRYAYFRGCSTGGEQGLNEAQRFPSDYDGIVAGDPGNNRTHLNTGFLWAYEASHKNGASILPVDKLKLINKAAIAACDALDGIKDGIISDPRLCHFDPGTLQCHGANYSHCLSAEQVEAVRKIYEGARNPRTGEQIIPGYEPGSEFPANSQFGGWNTVFAGGSQPPRLDLWKYWVFDDPNWSWRTFDFDRDLAYADRKMAVLNAMSTNLAAFKARGGKIVMYSGWADPIGPPQDAINYYEAVTQTMGGPDKTVSFFRLFMVPGMSHCGGGPGPSPFGGAYGNNPASVKSSPENDWLDALDRWVERGI